jgi:hypothetical protein
VQPQRIPLFRRRIILAITMVVLAGLAPSPVAAQAKPTATSFYSATTTAYKAWAASTSTARPAKTTSFGCQTTTVAFYFEYANAVPKHTKLQILVYLHTGNGPESVEARTTPFTLTHKSGLAMNTVTEKSGFEGPYRAMLLVDGHAAQHADFFAKIDGGEC